MSLTKVNLVNFTSPPYLGADFQATLFSAALGLVPAEGVWIPTFFLKNLSLDITGSMSALSVQLLGSNSFSDPGNATTVTVGGTVTTGDTVAVNVASASLPGGTGSASYTAIGGDTTATIATKLAAAIGAAFSQTLGLIATAVGSVITINYPSAVPPAVAEGVSPTDPAIQNICLFSGTVGGGATETLAFANASTGSSLGTAITALGMTEITTFPRWIKAQIATLTGTGANVTGNLHGAA